MSLDIPFLLRAMDTISDGLAITLLLSLTSIVLALIWGIPIVIGLLSSSKPVRAITHSYVEIVRNTPILVQIFFIYFGSGSLGYPLSGFTTGLIALVLQNGAYVAEIYRGGIQSVPHRQTEAGLAIGLTPRRAFGIIVLPQALRKVIPPISNQGILMIKDTSLVATISVAELTFHARLLADRTAAVFEIFFVLAIFYIVITALFGGIMRIIEKQARVN